METALTEREFVQARRYLTGYDFAEDLVEALEKAAIDCVFWKGTVPVRCKLTLEIDLSGDRWFDTYLVSGWKEAPIRYNGMRELVEEFYDAIFCPDEE